MPDGSEIPLKVRSLVGLTSLLAVSVVRSDVSDQHERLHEEDGMVQK